MTYRLLVGGLSVLVMATSASAQTTQQGFYAGAALGVQFFTDNEDGNVDIEFDTGYAIGGVVGYRFGALRADVELNYQETDAEADIANSQEVNVEILRYTVNAYYDFLTLQLPVVPYAGGGLGLASIDADGGGNDETNFSWHIEGGASYEFAPNAEIVPSYRYEWIDDSGLVSDDPVTSHVLRIGARWNF